MVEFRPSHCTHGTKVTDITFSSNGKILATGSLDGSVRLWDTGALEVGWLVDWFLGSGLFDVFVCRVRSCCFLPPRVVFPFTLDRSIYLSIEYLCESAELSPND